MDVYRLVDELDDLDDEGEPEQFLYVRINSHRREGANCLLLTVFDYPPTEKDTDDGALVALDLDYFNNNLQVLVYDNKDGEGLADEPRAFPLVSNVRQ